MPQAFEIAGAKLSLPDGYLPMRPMPDDPPGSLPLGMEGPGATCFAMVMPVDPAQAMPFADPQDVIDGIHDALADDQGLVEVESSMTASGLRCIHSIVKTAVEPAGVQYALTLDLEMPQFCIRVQGFFDEAGTTGARDAAVFAMTGAAPDGWRRDPYDPKRTAGNLMNLSELPEYDSAFPQHPLSLLRGFVASILRDN